MTLPPRILLADADAFFAAVARLVDPEGAGKAALLIVGGRRGSRGVVCSASWEARQYGVRSAMPIGRAARLCPHAVFLPVDMAKYQRVSAQVMAILGAFSPLVEQVSVDEAFLDLTGTVSLHGQPVDALRQIKRRVRAETGLTASAGLAANKFVAKVASDLGKPDGLVVVDPATEQPVAECPAASLAQLDTAVAAARRAFEHCQFSTDAERRAKLHAIADRIEAHAAELAELIVREQGKPLALARMEVGGGVAWTRAAADLDLPVELIEDRPGKRIELHRKPLGVVGSITPWNWPFMIAVWHVMPAVRAGNTVVIKPSSLTPLSTLRLVALMNEVLPAGVINVVTGEGGLGRAMSGHAGISKIVFTGSTPTGQDIMRNAAGNLKRLTLELGGNDAGIVLADVDVDAVAPAIFQAVSATALASWMAKVAAMRMSMRRSTVSVPVATTSSQTRAAVVSTKVRAERRRASASRVATSPPASALSRSR